MKPSHVLHDLPEYLEGRTPSSESARIRAHLESCPGCRAEAEELRSLLGRLSRERTDVPAPAYWSSLLPNIRSRIEDPGSRVVPAWVMSYVLPVSGALLIILFLLRFPTGNHQTEDLGRIVTQLTDEDLTPLVDEELVSSLLAGGLVSGDPSATSDDSMIIAELLEGVVPELNTDASDATQLLEGLSSDDLDNLAVVLEQQYRDM